MSHTYTPLKLGIKKALLTTAMLFAFGADAFASRYPTGATTEGTIQVDDVEVALASRDPAVAHEKLSMLKALNRDLGMEPAFERASERYNTLKRLAQNIEQGRVVKQEQAAPVGPAPAGGALFKTRGIESAYISDKGEVFIDYYPGETIGDLKNRIRDKLGIEPRIVAGLNYAYLNQLDNDGNFSVPDDTPIPAGNGHYIELLDRRLTIMPGKPLGG